MSWGKRFIFALAFAGLAFTMHGVSASDACRAGRAGGTPPSVGDTYIHVYLVSECKVGAGVATTPDPGVAIGAGVTSLDADGDGIRDFTLTVALDQASDRSFAADAKITLTKTEAGPITDKLYFEARAAIAGDGERIGFDFGFDTSGYNRRGEVDTARMPRFSTSVPENIVITATTSLRLKDPVEKQPTELRVELTEDSDRHALRLFADVCAPYGTCAAEHLTTSVAMSHVPSGRTPALDSATRSAAGGSLDGVPGDADEARRNAQAHAEGTAQDVTGIASGAANGDTEKVQSDAEDGIGRQRQYSGPRPVMTLRYWKNGDGRLVRYCAGMPPVNVSQRSLVASTFTALFPIPHIDGQIKFVRSASADEKALILEGDLQITDFPGDLAVDVNDLPGSNEIIVRRNPVEPPPTLTSRKLIIKESENDPEALAIHELSLIGIPTSATIVAGDDDVQVRAGTSTCEASGSEELSEAAVHVTRGKPTVTAPAIARLRPDDNVLRVSARTQLAPGSTSGRATAMDVRTTLHGVKAFCYKRPRDGSPGRFTLDALTGGTGRFTTAIDSIDVTSNSHIAGVVTIDPMPQEVHLAYDPDSRTLSGSSSAAADLKIHGLEALGTHDETSMPFVIAPRELQDDDLLQAWLRDEGRPSADDLHTWVHTGGRQDGQRINLHWELSSGRFHFRQPGFGSIPWQSSTRESWWNADVDAPGERYPVFPNEGKAVHVSLSYSGISMGPLHVVSDRRTPDGATPPNMRIDTTRERTIVEAAVVPLELDLVIDFLRNDFYKTGIINVTGTTTGDRPSVRLRMFDLLSDPSEDGCAAPRAPLPEETFDTGSVPTDVNGEVIPELELDIANIPSAFGVQINTFMPRSCNPAEEIHAKRIRLGGMRAQVDMTDAAYARVTAKGNAANYNDSAMAIRVQGFDDAAYTQERPLHALSLNVNVLIDELAMRSATVILDLAGQLEFGFSGTKISDIQLFNQRTFTFSTWTDGEAAKLSLRATYSNFRWRTELPFMPDDYTGQPNLGLVTIPFERCGGSDDEDVAGGPLTGSSGPGWQLDLKDGVATSHGVFVSTTAALVGPLEADITSDMGLICDQTPPSLLNDERSERLGLRFADPSILWTLPKWAPQPRIATITDWPQQQHDHTRSGRIDWDPSATSVGGAGNGASYAEVAHSGSGSIDEAWGGTVIGTQHDDCVLPTPVGEVRGPCKYMYIGDDTDSVRQIVQLDCETGACTGARMLVPLDEDLITESFYDFDVAPGIYQRGPSEFGLAAVNSNGTIFFKNTARPDAEACEREADSGSGFTAPLILPDNRVVAGGGDEISLFQPPGACTSSFDRTWGSKFGGDLYAAPAANFDGSRIYAVDEDGVLRAISSEHGGKVDETQLLDRSTYGSLVTLFGGDGREIVVVPQDGRITARWRGDLSEEVWSQTTNDEVHASPAVGPDGTIYMWTQDDSHPLLGLGSEEASCLTAYAPNGVVFWNACTTEDNLSDDTRKSHATKGTVIGVPHGIDDDPVSGYATTTVFSFFADDYICAWTAYGAPDPGACTSAEGPPNNPQSNDLNGTMSMSKDGSLFFHDTGSVRSNDGCVHELRFGGSGSPPLRDCAPAPALGTLAYSDGGEYKSIWTMQADGSARRRLTGPGATVDTQPVPSPDGSMIAFSRGAPGGYHEIYVMNADGSDPRQITTTATALDANYSPTWSPDGKEIAYTRGRIEMETCARSPDCPAGQRFAVYSDLHKISLEDSLETALTNTPTIAESMPSWSPAGDSIAYASWPKYIFSCSEDCPFGIWKMPADGGVQRMLWPAFAVTSPPAWSSSGRELAFVAMTCPSDDPECEMDFVPKLWTMTADGTDVRERRRFDLAHDGYPATVSWSKTGHFALTIAWWILDHLEIEVGVLHGGTNELTHITRGEDGDQLWPHWIPGT